MTITEILRYYDIASIASYSPYVYRCFPSSHQSPSWWEDIGGTPFNYTERINVAGLYYYPNNQFSQLDNLLDVQNQSSSFYFDDDNQILYIHIPQDYEPLSINLRLGETQGYSDNATVIYINNIPYLPLLKAVPSLTSQADLQKYNKMAFVSGAHTFDNTSRYFDEIINNDIYGNDIYDYYLPTDANRFDYARSELQPLASFYVEDYSHTFKEFRIEAQDKRKSQNIDILDVEEIPLIYGKIKSYKPKTIEGTLPAPTFRLGKNLTDLGIVEVEGEFGWVACTPFDIDLANGTFKISATEVRSGGNDTGSIFPVRVREFTGIQNSSALDVIVDLNKRVLNLDYTTSNYDITEWETAKTKIHDISCVFDKQQKIFEAIQKIQSGCNVGFLYKIDSLGHRTILINDIEKQSLMTVDFTEIKDNLTDRVATDSSIIAAIATIKYNKDYYENSFTPYENKTRYDEVLRRYRQAPTFEIETFINKESDAIQRSEEILKRFSSIPKVVEIILHGNKFYNLKIYDIITVRLKNEHREYYGEKKIQIIYVSPKLGKLETKIKGFMINES